MRQPSPFEVVFYGVRGSRPVAEGRVLEYGGNTSCVAVHVAGVWTVFDAGWGIVRAGQDLKDDSQPVSVFLTHLHHDHLGGLMFFAPVYQKDREITVHAPAGMVDAVVTYWSAPYFPMHLLQTPARVQVQPIASSASLALVGGTWLPADRTGGRATAGGGATNVPRLDTLHVNADAHPLDGITFYRVTHLGRRVVYIPDVELARTHQMDLILDFCQGADVLICDSAYTQEEYERSYQGWGHSSVELVTDLARRAQVGRLVLFHHDPIRDDAGVAAMEVRARERFANSVAAREGMRLVLQEATGGFELIEGGPAGARQPAGFGQPAAAGDHEAAPEHHVDLRAQLKKLTQIGIALSAERNLDRLLEMIVDEAMSFTNADGGTLYLVDGTELRFKIVENRTLGLHMGGATGSEITWPALPLYKDGKPNHENVSAYVALTGEAMNIPDVYNAEGFNFEGTRRADERNRYRSRSCLVVPLRDHEDQIIGVLQLWNAQDPDTRQVIPFDPDYVDLIASLASQAAVAIDNVRLIQDTENLFEAFVRVMASAIDERSPTTANHIKNVTELTVALAKVVNETDEGPFKDVRFSEDELNEIRIAAWMHDVGKVTTPIHIVEKVTKLEGIHDRIEVVKTRFDLIKQITRSEYLERRMQLLQEGAPAEELARLDGELAGAVQTIEDEKEFVVFCNTPVEFMPPERIERLRRIAEKTYRLDGEEHPYLTDEEFKHLSVQRGNITGEELQIMRDHAAVSIRLLSQIPFTRKLQNVPRHAGAHHEKLNGQGYPLGLKAEEISIQTRMMSIADVYEALTAKRSYKEGRTQEEALRILGFMVKDGDLDGDLVELFVRSGVYRMCGKPAAEVATPSKS